MSHPFFNTTNSIVEKFWEYGNTILLIIIKIMNKKNLRNIQKKHLQIYSIINYNR